MLAMSRSLVKESRMDKRLLPAFGLSLALLLVAVDGWARVKLITLPVREQVEIQLAHPDATLVEEERIVPLVQGANQVDFSWSNTSIDSASILFRLVDDGDGVQAQVLSVSYPPGENALVWDLWAEQAGSARVRIGYLIGGLGKSYHYRATADVDESRLNLEHYLRLDNRSNERFEGASIKAGYGEPLEREVGIAETKDLLLAEYRDVPIVKRYTAALDEHGYIDAAEKKLRIPMHYVLKNDAAHGLGQGALPFGKARIFMGDGKGGTAFVGEDWGQFTPRDDEMALYLGVARDIVVKRTIERNDAQRINGNLYNYDIVIKYEIENFKERSVVLDLVEDVRRIRRDLGRENGRAIEWELGKETTLGDLDDERSGLETLVFHQPLPPKPTDGEAKKIVAKLHLRLKNEW
jgi:hypothetical protein